MPVVRLHESKSGQNFDLFCQKIYFSSHLVINWSKYDNVWQWNLKVVRMIRVRYHVEIKNSEIFARSPPVDRLHFYPSLFPISFFFNRFFSVRFFPALVRFFPVLVRFFSVLVRILAVSIRFLPALVKFLLVLVRILTERVKIITHQILLLTYWSGYILW